MRHRSFVEDYAAILAPSGAQLPPAFEQARSEHSPEPWLRALDADTRRWYGQRGRLLGPELRRQGLGAHFLVEMFAAMALLYAHARLPRRVRTHPAWLSRLREAAIYVAQGCGALASIIEDLPADQRRVLGEALQQPEELCLQLSLALEQGDFEQVAMLEPALHDFAPIARRLGFEQVIADLLQDFDHRASHVGLARDASGELLLVLPTLDTSLQRVLGGGDDFQSEVLLGLLLVSPGSEFLGSKAIVELENSYLPAAVMLSVGISALILNSAQRLPH